MQDNATQEAILKIRRIYYHFSTRTISKSRMEIELHNLSEEAAVAAAGIAEGPVVMR